MNSLPPASSVPAALRRVGAERSAGDRHAPSAPASGHAGADVAAHAALARPVAASGTRIIWGTTIGVIGVHVLATLAFIPWFFSWTGVTLALFGLYVFGTLGINLCFHRLLTHRQFRVPLVARTHFRGFGRLLPAGHYRLAGLWRIASIISTQMISPTRIRRW